jgi:hypothetical protein
MKRRQAELREYRRAIDALGAAWKDPHYARCGRCHEVSFMALLEGGAEDLGVARRLCVEHAAAGADLGMPACDLEACVFHEEVAFEVARRMMRMERAGFGGTDRRGRKTAAIEREAWMVLLRFTRRRATAHVLAYPPAAGDRETHWLEAIARGWDEHFEGVREAALAGYGELRGLAEGDLEMEPATGRERRGPFR